MKNVNVPSSSFLQNSQNSTRAIQDLYWCLKELTESSSSYDEKINSLESEIYTLKQQIGKLGGDVVYNLPNDMGKSFNALMSNNGIVKLTDDVTTGRFGPGITASNKVTLSMNNHNLTVTNAGNNGGIQARGTQVIDITGKGTIDTGDGICILANSANAVINLKGSTTTYQTNRPNAELIYCYAGTINISGGTFKNNGSPYLLNCYDANYKNGKANIVVTGGKFYDFDPANNTAEGENTSFLAEGYTSVATTVTEGGVEHIVYTVKKG